MNFMAKTKNTSNGKFRHLVLISAANRMKKSQSALEYMMTYGWAILVIVAVAIILYSMGVFSPSSFVSATVTGFLETPVTSAVCTSNGVLRLTVGDATGHAIDVTTISGTGAGKTVIFAPNSTVDPNTVIQHGQTYTFSISDICPPPGSSYSIAVRINYTEPDTPFANAGYSSKGTVAGTTSSSGLPASAAFFNGQNYAVIAKSGNQFYTQGADSYINATDPLPGINVSYTLVMWASAPSIYGMPNSSFQPGGSAYNSYGLFAFNQGSNHYQQFGVGPTDTNNLTLANSEGRNGPGLHRCTPADVWANVTTDFFNGQWHFVAVSVSKPSYLFQFDGNQYSKSNNNGFSSGPLIAIGAYGFGQCDEGPFIGYISNVQLYSGSLSASQLLTLYREGIMGSPLSASGVPLVGWWPLNGTPRDFAGSDNGNLVNSYFTSSFPP